jgi:hypothetical protein
VVIYSEYEYELWCRRRAAARGSNGDDALFWMVRRQDRHIFEAAVRERDRSNRQPSDLTELSDLMGMIGGAW